MSQPASDLTSTASTPLRRARDHRASWPLLPGAVIALAMFGTAPAQASNEGWPGDIIQQVRHQSPTEDAGRRPRRRRSAVERLNDYMIDEEAVRPRRHARRHHRSDHHLAHRHHQPHRAAGSRLASLGRGLPPATTPQAGARPAKAAAIPVPSEAAPKGPAVASLGTTPVDPPATAAPRLAGAPIKWGAPPDCLASPLRTVLAEVAALFGAVHVNSTCRSKRHNARVGGASRSYHLTGQAVDFRIGGNIGAVSHFLLGKKTVGGFKHYGFGLFHIDTGPRRTWASGPYGRRHRS